MSKTNQTTLRNAREHVIKVRKLAHALHAALHRGPTGEDVLWWPKDKVELAVLNAAKNAATTLCATIDAVEEVAS